MGKIIFVNGHKFYYEFDGIRLIYEDNRLTGWYNPELDEVIGEETHHDRERVPVAVSLHKHKHQQQNSTAATAKRACDLRISVI